MKEKHIPISLDLSKDLFKWKVDAYPGIAYAGIMGLCVEIKKEFGHQWPSSEVLFRGKECAWWSNWEDIDHHGQALLRMFWDPQREGYNARFHRIYNERTSALARRVDAIERLGLRGLSPGRFITVWNDFFRCFARFWSIGEVPEITGYAASRMLERRLREKHPGKADEFLAKLSHFAEKSFHFKEESELMGIAIAVKKYPSVRDRLMERHTKRYRWINLNYGNVHPAGRPYFERRLADMLRRNDLGKRYADSKKYTAAVRKDTGEFVKREGIDPQAQTFGAMTRTASYYQDDRKKFNNKGCLAIARLYGELARRIRTSLDDALYILSAEASQAIGDPALWKKDIKRRKERFRISIKDDIVQVTTEGVGDTCARIEEAFTRRGTHEGITGLIASPGKAQGRVKIINNIGEIKDFPRNHVLVTEMTSPEYVVAMRRAVAVVTDLGGATSHAAVISREIGIPCIVGTKIATKALQDGDYIEVDADKGVVRIIKTARSGKRKRA
ncbi:MAG TPA: PEP-utilizing enzyme [Candidatus Nanoarchaeia archaeon]|nr:PEP-utilizing enzyme [Candidatus Nanoarchaeia archaeon]